MHLMRKGCDLEKPFLAVLEVAKFSGWYNILVMISCLFVFQAGAISTVVCFSGLRVTVGVTVSGFTCNGRCDT